VELGAASFAKRRGLHVARITKATKLVAFFFPVADLFVATQYDILFKLSISTFHVSVMAITPAIASHKVRHPSWGPSNFSVFMTSD
jgi:hypothetical protein